MKKIRKSFFQLFVDQSAEKGTAIDDAKYNGAIRRHKDEKVYGERGNDELSRSKDCATL